MAAVEAVRLDLPAEWRSLPVTAAELRTLLASDETVGGLSSLSMIERRRVELFLQRFVADLESVNVVLAAMTNMAMPRESAEGTSDEPDATALVATCSVSVMTRATLGSSAPLNADVVLAAMSLDRPDGDDRSVVSTNLEPPSIIELSAGRSVRIPRLVEQQLTVKDSLKVFTDTYFVPVPDDFDVLLVAQFATINIEDSAVFAELFGAMANTIRFYREGEPTEL